MAKTLYDMMDWPEIETIIYSESDDPHVVLGPHKISKGTLVQAFLPEAVKVSLKLKENGKLYPMELMEEPGFFAVLLPKKTKPDYTYLVTMEDGTENEMEDPYRFEPVWDIKDTQKFQCGTYYNVYEKMGAIPMIIDGTEGVLFSVWAPNAMRVSVVGDFNNWDGRIHQMRRLWDSGIFELFIPGVKAGSIYKYELKLKGNQISMKSDPYGAQMEGFPGAASIVADQDAYIWQDEKWMKERKGKNALDAPIAIYQLHLNTFSGKDPKGAYRNYRDIAEDVCRHVKSMGYTHVLVMALNEYSNEETCDYQTFGYYAPTSRFGSANDFKYFVDYLHQEGIGVMMQWTPIFFEKHYAGLSAFDGTYLYEHQDVRQGFNEKRNACIFNYARGEVKNYLIASVMFWADKYHIDGIDVCKTDAVLYLDYDKELGQWIPNMYGSNENLDGIELFKHMNSVFKKQHEDVLLMADEKSGWPRVTGAVKDDDLGFDLKLNNGWTEDVLPYMEMAPLFRSGSYYDMLMGMIYAYTDNYVLPLDWDKFRDGQPSMYGRMPGTEEQKMANLRALYGYMMCHPGKKLMFMGQEYGRKSSWSLETPLKLSEVEMEPHKQMADYMAAWNEFYKKEPALYALDFEPDGFQWINQISANENIIVFVRKTDKKEDTLLIVCNFAPQDHEDYKIGVPYAGKYKEVFNSDASVFGGGDFVNPRVKNAKEDECDGREFSIRIKVAPLGVSVFKYNPIVEKSVSGAGKQAPSKDTKESASGNEKKSSLKQTLSDKMKEAEALGDVEKQMKAAKVVAEKKKQTAKK